MAGRKLRTVFFGSSAFAVPSLQRMRESQDVVVVCSQPDRPAGRGLKLRPTPVAALARGAGLDVVTPERLDSRFIDRIKALHPELLACASYGKIIPAAVLELPGMSPLNVHPSLLPRFRGATPIQSALRAGCSQTGVTIFWMTSRMDAGDVALQRAVSIEPTDDYGVLHDRLAQIGADLLGDAATLLADGKLPRVPQREEDASYCRPLTKDDLQLRFDVPARSVVNQVRSLSPQPGARMMLDGAHLKVLAAEIADRDDVPEAWRAGGIEPGAVFMAQRSAPLVASADGAVRLLRVVSQGRPAMSGLEFAQAHSARR